MYGDYIKLFETSLEMYEQTKSKLVPLTAQIDLVSSMFETNDDTGKAEISSY